MIQVVMSYDIVPGVGQKAYAAWVKKGIGTVLEQSGLVEFRAFRNMLGSPQARNTTEWATMADWEKFNLGAWQTIEAEMHPFVTNLKIELWGPSPMAPQPLRPGK